jgi:hypothetical protein
MVSPYRLKIQQRIEDSTSVFQNSILDGPIHMLYDVEVQATYY